MKLTDENIIDDLIILDVDDTLLDTMTGFVKWLGKHNRLKAVTGSAIASKDQLGDWLGVSNDLANHWMRDFCERSWEWGALYPVADSQKVITELYKRDWNFIGMSRGAGGLDRGTLRRANLELIFPGVIEELYVLGLSASVYPLIKDYTPSICITADVSVAKSSAGAGHITYLIDQPWNRDFNNLSVKRFNSWFEVLQALDNLPQQLG